MGDEHDPDYTLTLNLVPQCCEDNQSLLPKADLAVYTCEHLLCLDCFTHKADLCRMNDGGKFAFFLSECQEGAEAAKALRALMPEFVKSQRSREGQQVARLIMKLQHIIRSRLVANPEDVQIVPERPLPSEAMAEIPDMPEQVLESQGSEGNLPDSGASNPNPADPDTNPLLSKSNPDVSDPNAANVAVSKPQPTPAHDTKSGRTSQRPKPNPRKTKKWCRWCSLI